MYLIVIYRAGDGADGVDESVAADSDAGAGAARTCRATDRRRERHSTPCDPLPSALLPSHRALCECYLRFSIIPFSDRTNNVRFKKGK